MFKKILIEYGGKLLKAIPGSGIVTEVKNVFNKDMPETWVHLGFYAVGVLALWIGVAYGFVNSDNFIKFFKLIF